MQTSTLPRPELIQMADLVAREKGIEKEAVLKAMEEGIVPPTINLDNIDPELPNLNYVPHKAVNANLEYTMSNSFGFGGHDASIILKKYIP